MYQPPYRPISCIERYNTKQIKQRVPWRHAATFFKTEIFQNKKVLVFYYTYSTTSYKEFILQFCNPGGFSKPKKSSKTQILHRSAPQLVVALARFPSVLSFILSLFVSSFLHPVCLLHLPSLYLLNFSGILLLVKF